MFSLLIRRQLDTLQDRPLGFLLLSNTLLWGHGFSAIAVGMLGGESLGLLSGGVALLGGAGSGSGSAGVSNIVVFQGSLEKLVLESTELALAEFLFLNSAIWANFSQSI